MKKKLMVIVVCAAFVLATILVACSNKTLVDTTYKFDYAIVALPDGRVVSGKVSTWTDYDDSDAVQVTIDGNTYYTHLTNVCLMPKPID